MGRGVENEEFVCNERPTALMCVYACIFIYLKCFVFFSRVQRIYASHGFCVFMNDVAIIVNDSKINNKKPCYVSFGFSPILN